MKQYDEYNSAALTPRGSDFREPATAESPLLWPWQWSLSSYAWMVAGTGYPPVRLLCRLPGGVSFQAQNWGFSPDGP